MDFEKDKPAERQKMSKRNKPTKNIFLIVFLYILFAGAVLFLVDGRHPKFYMTGEQQMVTACGSHFEDPGIYAVLTGRVFGEGTKRLPVQTMGKVDTETLGIYDVTYAVRYLFRNYSCVRTVAVEDMTPPEIILIHKADYRASWLRGYEEEGYKATDNIDGDITDRVVREETESSVRYTVSDSAGNETSVSRQIEYASTRPEMLLIGSEVLHVPTGLSFQDPGCTARDSLGNDLTRYVVTDGKVIPYEEGAYELTYSITNAAGEMVRTKRTVITEAQDAPETVYPEDKTIYLTFDGGPGPYTDDLLDVLKNNNVRATFFVTCMEPEYSSCIRRAFEEGHSIGVLSAGNDYRSIYKDEEEFFADFRKVQELICDQTGSYTRLCRFPGGSSNTVSTFNDGIMTRLAKDLNGMGYQYFDWDLAPGDSGEATKTDVIYSNVINGITGRQTTVLQQHDTNEFSVAATEKIIKWGKRCGYVFRPLEVNSPPAHQTIVN